MKKFWVYSYIIKSENAQGTLRDIHFGENPPDSFFEILWCGNSPVRAIKICENYDPESTHLLLNKIDILLRLHVGIENDG